MKHNLLKRNIFFFLFCLWMGNLAFAYTERNLLQKQITPDKLKEALVIDQKWVPFPTYTDRNGWDALLGDFKETCIRKGEKRLGYKWQIVKATDYLEYERSGNRQVMEKPFNDNTIAITDLLLAELAEGKGRFIDQLINGVFYSCEMTSWAASAHLSAQKSRSCFPEYKEDIIELAGSDLAATLSWTYYYLHQEFDKVNPEISRRLRHELQKRILDAYMGNDSFWWMAVNYKPGQLVNNWNPWCNSNSLLCFMLLENDRDKLAEAVYRSMQSVDRFINYTHSDGACEEGPSYWGHAAGKMLDYLEMLSGITGGQVSIFDEPMIKSMGEYISRSYVGDGWVVNFADASAKGGGEPYLIYRFGKAVNSDELKGFAALMNQPEKQPTAGRDFYRTLHSLNIRQELRRTEATHDVPSFTWYPETEFCYISDKNGNFFAAKGGYNNESHNHNDAGSFSFWLHHTPIIIDAGVGTYTRQTFSGERYSIWTMQSNFHNLPMINGVAQKFGSKYKVTGAKANKNKNTFTVDLATAYPEEAAVRSWNRTYAYKKGQVRISDSFDLKAANKPNQINFLTWGTVDTAIPGKVFIEADGQKAVLEYDAAKMEAAIETIRLDDPRLSNVWGKQIYRIMLTGKQLKEKNNYIFTIKEL